MRIGYFRSKSTRGIHVAADTGGDVYCSCPAFYYHGRCWHTTYLKHGLGGVGGLILRVDELEGKIRQYKSSIEGLNQAFGGYLYASGEMLGIYGLPNVGKTLFMLQEGHYIAAKQGGKVLYIDTEGSAVTMYKAWRPAFETKWGKAPELYFAIVPDIHELMKLFGYDITIQLKGQKVEVAAELLGKSEVESHVREKGITFLILDSLTAPIRNAFPSAPQNFPARSDVQSMIFATLARIASEGVAIAVTHHASINPSNPYDVHEEIRGGLAVKYFTKRLINITRREKKGMEDIRKFIILRSPRARERGQVVIAKITDNGFIDVPFSPEYLTESELRFVTGGEREKHEPEQKGRKHSRGQQ